MEGVTQIHKEPEYTGSISSDVTQKVSQQIEHLAKKGLVPNMPEAEDKELDSADFQEMMVNSGQILNKILELLPALEQSVSDKDNILSNSWAKTSVSLVILVAQYASSKNLWSTTETSQLAQDILSRVLLSAKCQSLNHLFSWDSDLSKKIFLRIQPFLTSSNWRQNPGMKAGFSWILINMKFPNVKNVLNEVLPVSLLFVDDYRVENKLLGIECFLHVINNVTPTEIVRYGWNEVIYSALKRLSYTSECSLLTPVHSCLIAVVKLDSKLNAKVSQLEENFYRVLLAMEGEQRIVLRQAYSRVLSLYVNEIGINNVRWLQRTLRVLARYLEIYEGPEEISRRNSLCTLQALIKLSWPRIPMHTEFILKSLSRFLYDINDDNISTPENVRKELQEEVIRCLILLKKIDRDRFVELWDPLESVCTTELSNIRNVISIVKYT